MSAMVYCFDCEDTSPPTNDGFCWKCDSDNVFSYDTDEVEKMVGGDAKEPAATDAK